MYFDHVLVAFSLVPTVVYFDHVLVAFSLVPTVVYFDHVLVAFSLVPSLYLVRHGPIVCIVSTIAFCIGLATTKHYNMKRSNLVFKKPTNNQNDFKTCSAHLGCPMWY